MTRTLLSLTAAALVAALAHTAAADCTIAYPMAAKKYWPTSAGYVPKAGDHRCDFAGPNNSVYDCQLSGWLITPTSTGAGNLDAVIYIDDAFRNADRHHACETINAMVARGFVVFYADQRGQWDYSGGGSYAFHNTGYFTWDWANMNASTFVPADAIATDYLADQAADLDYAVTMLLGLKAGSNPLVDPHHITVMGREDGAITALATPAHLSSGHHVAAVVDLGGGSRHWATSTWHYWNDAIQADAAACDAPMFIQEVGNESPNGSYWSAMAAFNGATASDAAASAKLALYAGFTPSADEQATCNSSGWDDQLCGNYWFANDHALVSRWWQVAYDWLYRVDGT